MPPTAVDVEKTRRNALKAIREGRVAIRSVAYADGMKAVTAAGLVRGHTGHHEVTYMLDSWRCTCTQVAMPCPHVLAVQLVTGHAGSVAQAQPAPPPDVDDATECRHGMTAAFCADCTGRDGGQAALAQEHEALLKQPGWTRAAFGGRCARCGEAYGRDEPIRAVRKADQSPGTVWAASCCQEVL